MLPTETVADPSFGHGRGFLAGMGGEDASTHLISSPRGGNILVN